MGVAIYLTHKTRPTKCCIVGFSQDAPRSNLTKNKLRTFLPYRVPSSRPLARHIDSPSKPRTPTIPIATSHGWPNFIPTTIQLPQLAPMEKSWQNVTAKLLL